MTSRRLPANPGRAFAPSSGKAHIIRRRCAGYSFDSVAASRLPHPCGAAPASLSVSAPVGRFGSKPDGSQRPLGVPTVLDRMIQQAIAQVLTPLYDGDFSQHSYGLPAT